MKRKIFLFAALATVMAVSCSKKSDTPTPTPVTPASGVININGEAYNESIGKDTITNDFFGVAGNIFYGLGITKDSQKYQAIYMIFKNNFSRPTAGSYPIGLTANNHVSIVINDSSAAGQGLYSSDSLTSYSINVTVNSGKITATIPTIKLTGLYTPAGHDTYNDTIIISGTLIEK
jgi:hypothetical protein